MVGMVVLYVVAMAYGGWWFVGVCRHRAGQRWTTDDDRRVAAFLDESQSR